MSITLQCRRDDWDDYDSRKPALTNARYSSHITASQLIVYSAIKEIQPCTDREIEAETGLDINQVTGRRNELAKGGWIVRAGEKWSENARAPVDTWKIAREQNETERPAEIGQERFQ